MTLLRRIFQPNTLIELFPALLFFLVNLLWGFRAATVAGMLATPAAIAAGWLLLRRIPTIPLVSLALVVALGGASLLLDDATFVKLRPTIGSGLFALALAVGLLFRPSFLPRAFAGQLFLSSFGWRLLACWIAVRSCRP